MVKKMSDSEVNDFAFKKLTGDLDHIDADTTFAESDEPAADPHNGVTITAHGVNVNIKPMNGEQTKDQPVVKDEDEEKSELGELGL